MKSGTSLEGDGVKSWFDNLIELVSYINESDDSETSDDVYELTGQIIITGYLHVVLNNPDENAKRENLGSIREGLTELLEDFDIQLEIPSELTYCNSSDYLEWLYEQLGLKEYEFELPGVTMDNLVCERSTSMPQLYQELSETLSYYRE